MTLDCRGRPNLGEVLDTEVHRLREVDTMSCVVQTAPWVQGNVAQAIWLAVESDMLLDSQFNTGGPVALRLRRSQKGGVIISRGEVPSNHPAVGDAAVASSTCLLRSCIW